MDELTDIEDVTTTMKPLMWRNLTARQRRWALRHPVRTWRHTQAVNAVYDEAVTSRFTRQVAREAYGPVRFGDDGKLWHIGVLMLVGLACWVGISAVAWWVLA